MTQGLSLGPQVGLCRVWLGLWMVTCPDLARGLAPWGHVPEALGRPSRHTGTPRPTAAGSGTVSITAVPEAAS